MIQSRGKNREQTSSSSNQSLTVVIDMQLTPVKKVYFRASVQKKIILTHQKVCIII